MFRKSSIAIGAAALVIALVGTAAAGPADSAGIVTVRSAHGLAETVERIRQDVTSKGITWFGSIDQAELGNAAGNRVLPSTLVMFGNPALGTTFVTANQKAGLDWPVRVLVFQDETGAVFVAYTAFDWIAERHHIENRQAEFAMATKVIESVVGTVEEK